MRPERLWILGALVTIARRTAVRHVNQQEGDRVGSADVEVRRIGIADDEEVGSLPVAKAIRWTVRNHLRLDFIAVQKHGDGVVGQQREIQDGIGHAESYRKLRLEHVGTWGGLVFVGRGGRADPSASRQVFSPTRVIGLEGRLQIKPQRGTTSERGERAGNRVRMNRGSTTAEQRGGTAAKGHLNWTDVGRRADGECG